VICETESGIRQPYDDAGATPAESIAGPVPAPILLGSLNPNTVFLKTGFRNSVKCRLVIKSSSKKVILHYTYVSIRIEKHKKRKKIVDVVDASEHTRKTNFRVSRQHSLTSGQIQYHFQFLIGPNTGDGRTGLTQDLQKGRQALIRPRVSP